MAHTADGKKIRVGMPVYDRVHSSNRRLKVYEIRGNDIRVGGGCGVSANSVYSSREALSISERVLIFGGTFDPIHNGHLIACRTIAEELGIDRVILIPSGKHPYKHDITPAADRLEMVKQAVEDEYLFEVCDCEFNREGFSYSSDTAVWIKQELHKKMEEVYWVIGEDNIKEIPKWYKAADFVKEVRFAVAKRKTSNSLFDGTDEEKEIMDNMHIEYVDTPIIEISSSMVRERVKRGLSVKYLVPDKIIEYVDYEELYK
jgi:nicotinate-nucleotide adenylyltransferase